MFKIRQRQNTLTSALTILELTYHSVVHSIRSSHGNAVMALATNFTQMAIMVLAFYVMFSILGLRGAALRGDFLIYIMTGIFLYMTNIKAVSAVAGSAGPSSTMMLHAPMNTIISVASSALAALYLQVLSMAVILLGYYMIGNRFEIHDPAGCIGMLVLAWFSGCSIGLCFLAAKPWFPGLVSTATLIYQRMNMIASGKMFVANTMPGFMLAMFDWNPLFHIIDQSRGFAFINYNPHHSSWQYAFWLSVTLVVFGMLGEHYTRRHASASWGAKR